MWEFPTGAWKPEVLETESSNYLIVYMYTSLSSHSEWSTVGLYLMDFRTGVSKWEDAESLNSGAATDTKAKPSSLYN